MRLMRRHDLSNDDNENNDDNDDNYGNDDNYDNNDNDNNYCNGDKKENGDIDDNDENCDDFEYILDRIGLFFAFLFISDAEDNVSSSSSPVRPSLSNPWMYYLIKILCIILLV